MHQNQREKRENERRNPPEEDPEFQIAPMIDILLVLLVFFMSIASTEVLQPNHQIELPVAADGKSASKNNPGQVIINVTWSSVASTGGIEVNNVKYEQPTQITPILEKAIDVNPLARVLIRADKEVRFEYMRALLKAVGDARVSNVTFAVTDKEVPPHGP